MIKEITIYEAFDGSRFDSPHEANNYEVRLKNQAIETLWAPSQVYVKDVISS